ncbi:hypothetical protein UJ101_01767 [Flavobacteriaceae bacterium UJ101]|nr:hypothetical protein UJ101_01767 [Flavobacteriaceae bacterium UJ101]
MIMEDKTVLNYTKEILEKVSFSVELFSREVKKAFRTLSKEEFQELLIFIKQMVVQKPQLEVCLEEIQ